MTTQSKPRTLKEYSQLYGIPLPTIVNCRRRKWPLDDPAALLKKFLDTKGNRVGNLAKLEEIAAGRLKVTTPQVKPSPPAKRRVLKPTTLKGGVTHELARLEEETARSFEEYQNEDSPALRVSLQKIYAANVNALQRLQKTARATELESQELLRRSEVDDTWTRWMVETRAMLEQLARRIATAALFKKLDPVDVETLVNSEVEKVQLQIGPTPWIEEAR